MRGNGTEVSSLVKELHSSVGISARSLPIPSITALMRNEFLPLVQCLEQSGDVLSKTYTIELLLTLARFDALLKEEERRAFVCAFDSLSRRLLKDLHYLVEVEGLLQKNILFLRELVERCRMIDHICTCRTRNNNNNNNNNNSSSSNIGSSSGLKENSRSTMVLSSFLHYVDSPGGAVDVKSQQKALDVLGGPSVNGSFFELQPLFHGDAGSNLQAMQPIAKPLLINESGGASANEVVSNQFTDLLPPADRMFQQQLPLGLETAPTQNNNEKPTSSRPEEFMDFLTGQLPKNDIISLVHMVFPHRSCCENRQDEANGDEKATSTGCTESNNRSCSLENSKNCGNDSVTDKSGSHPHSVETATPIQLSQKVDESDCNTQVADGFKAEEQYKRSYFSPSLGGSHTVNKTVLHLNMLLEVLLFGKSSADPSPNSSFGSLEEAEQNGVAADAAAVQHADLAGRLHAVPSKRALGLLSTVFPSLHNFAEEFKKFADIVAEEGFGTSALGGGCSGGSGGGNSTLASPRDTSRRLHGSFHRPRNPGNKFTFGDACGDVPHSSLPGSLISDSGGGIRPADVVFYAFIRSVQQSERDSTVTIAPLGKAQESAKETISSEDCPTSRTVTIPRQMMMQLELMINQIQESIDSTHAMQEQIREEVTFLVFRVLTTVMDFLIPAVCFVDRRVVIFYRKWICDMYRLLWEEELLGRFSAFVLNSSSDAPKDCFTTAVSLPPGASVATTQTHTSGTSGSSSGGGKRSSGKYGSSVTVTKHTNTPLPEKEDPKVDVEECTNEEENDMEVFISPGNAYSRAARNSGNVNESPAFSNALAAHASSFFFSQSSLADVDPHNFGFFDDPAVLLAESLLEDTSTETPPPRGVLITRLMAALLRGTSTDKLRRIASMQERGVRNRQRKERSPEIQPLGLRKMGSALRGRKQPQRKKNTPSPLKVIPSLSPLPPPPPPPPPLPLPLPIQPIEGTESRPVTSHQQQLGYPMVTNADEVKALYNSALFEAETLLSPHDPIRAALVQNTVDFLVSGLRNLTEAYEILDGYLDDVKSEPIQPFVTGRVAFESWSEHSRSGVDGTSSNNLHSIPTPLHLSDSSFPAVSVRHAKAMPSDSITASSATRGHSSHGGHVTSKRNVPVDRESGSAATVALPLIPKVIPSWNSKEESEQFLLILSLLRREYITLSTSPYVSALATKTGKKDASTK